MATYYGIQEDSDGNVLLPVPNGICGIERGASATQSYVKGNLVYVGNRLCQVNSAITVGDALTIGGNVSYTSMANQVHNIKVFVNNNGELVFTDHTGADTVLNFSQIYDLGTGTSFNVSSVSGYHNFTTANFMYRIGNANGHLVSGDQGQGWFAGSADFSDSYNSSTGVLTVSYRAYLMTPNSGPMHGSLTSVHAYLITKTSGIRPLPNP
jgi:energy-converting hydrogenase Eha subunit B